MLSRPTTVIDRLVEGVIRELPYIGPCESVCLGGVSFDQYRMVLKAQERLGRRLQISYFSGQLEVFPNALRSEVRRSVLRSFVWLAAEVLKQEMNALGSTTLAREAGDYGFDPQESFAFNLFAPDDAWSGDPRPDLLIEVNNPLRHGNRLALCARAGVPEVWYDDLEKMQVLSLRSDGTYSECDYSSAFPLIRSDDINRFLSSAHVKSLTAIMREFRGWLETTSPLSVSQA